MRLSGSCLCVTVVVVLAGSFGQADARRNATATERAAILQAVHAKQRPCDLYATGHCRELVRISTVRGSWAAVYVRPAKPAYQAEVQSDVGSVHRVNGKWRVHQIGNGGGCGVPVSVRRDLHLTCD